MRKRAFLVGLLDPARRIWYGLTSFAPCWLKFARSLRSPEMVAVQPPSVAAATSALRCALVFAGCTAPPSARVQALLGTAATGGAADLDAASAGFESTIRTLRGAAGFGESPAWHDAALHPWATPLEDEAAVVQAELQAALRSGGGSAAGGAAWDGAEYKAIASAWRFQHLWRDGHWLTDAAAQFPRTVAPLQRLD